MKQFHEGDTTLVIDDSHGDLYITTIYGAPTELVMRGYFDWYRPFFEERQRARRPFAHVTDALDADRPPPKVRAMVAELTDTLPQDKAVNPANYLVIGSALVRGAITAIQWLSQRPWSSVVVGTMEEALRRSVADLKAAGVAAPPIDIARYQRPPRAR
jgi:hypothetical protein